MLSWQLNDAVAGATVPAFVEVRSDSRPNMWHCRRGYGPGLR